MLNWFTFIPPCPLFLLLATDLVIKVTAMLPMKGEKNFLKTLKDQSEIYTILISCASGGGDSHAAAPMVTCDPISALSS